MPTPSPETPPLHRRFKDRLTYRHQIWRVDLTQVTTEPGAGSSTVSPAGRAITHELEMEVNEIKLLQRERSRVARSEFPNDYLGLVQVMVNNIRAIASRGDGAR